MPYFQLLEDGVDAPIGCQHIKLNILFDVNM